MWFEKTWKACQLVKLFGEMEELKQKNSEGIKNVRGLWHTSNTKDLKPRTKAYLNTRTKHRWSIRHKLCRETKSWDRIWRGDVFVCSSIWTEMFFNKLGCRGWRRSDISSTRLCLGLSARWICMFSQMSWLGETEQHVEFRVDLARMWFWNEYYLDLNNRSSQLRIDSTLHPQLEHSLRYDLGIFIILDDYI